MPLTTEETRRLELLQAESAALEQRGEFAESLVRVEEMLTLLRGVERPEPMDVAGCYGNLGHLHERLRHWPEAEMNYRQAVEVLETASGPNAVDTLPALDALAGFLSRREHLAEAEAVYRRQLRILTDSGETDTPRVASCLNDLAIVVRHQGRPREAEPFYLRVIEIIIAAVGPDDLNLASAYGNLALLYVDLRRLPDATDQLDRMERIFVARLPKAHAGYALLWRHRAMVAAASGNLVAAEALDREALRRREDAYGPDHLLTAEILHALGIDRFELGWLDDAAAMLARALVLREHLLGPDHLTTLLTCNAFAAVREEQGKFDEAESLYRRVLAGRERELTADHPAIVTSLNNLAALLERTKRYPDADALYARALAMATKVFPPHDPRLASLHNNYALLLIAMRRLEEAEAAYEHALAIQEQGPGAGELMHAGTLMNLALVRWRRRRFSDVLAPLRRAVEAQEQITTLLMTSGAERQKRDALASTIAQLYGVLTFHFNGQPRAADVRELAARAVVQRKGRLLDGLVSTIDRARHEADPNTILRLDRWIAVRSERAQLALAGPPPGGDVGYAQRLAELEQEEEELESDLGDLVRQRVLQPEGITVAEMCGALPAGAALIDFVRYSTFDPDALRGDPAWGLSRYAVFLFDRDGARHSADLGPADHIEQSILELRRALADPEQDYRQLARDVYRVLLGPLDAFLPEFAHLLISPDGALNVVPFAALIDATQRHLIENWSVTYVGSGRDLLSTRRADSAVGPPLVLAVAEARQVRDEHGLITFGKLEAVARETAALRELMPEARVLTGTDASIDALRASPRPRLLHIAGHAVFEERQRETTETHVQTRADDWHSWPSLPTVDDHYLLESWFVLGRPAATGAHDDAGASRRVSALELTTLDLRGTELVTLSACDTGVGRIRPGDGVYDLRRAFLLAGARSLVVSLWAADDQSTFEMMQGFYGRVRNGDRRVDALCLMQCALLNDSRYAHPYFWSNLVLIGDCERVAF